MSRFINPFTILLILVMAYNSLQSGRFNNPMEWLMGMLISLPGIVIGLSFHEFAHAYVADRCGDNTPRLQGRVTINPLAHVDPFGLICLIFIGFGWGKPVMINPRNFAKPRRDELLVSLAGVTMNLALVILFGVILAVFNHMNPVFFMDQTSMGFIIFLILDGIIRINIVLMVFNLIPVPPLDGFNVISEIFNLKHTDLYYKIYQNGMWILLALILFNIIDVIFRFTVTPLYAFVLNFALGF